MVVLWPPPASTDAGEKGCRSLTGGCKEPTIYRTGGWFWNGTSQVCFGVGKLISASRGGDDVGAEMGRSVCKRKFI